MNRRAIGCDKRGFTLIEMAVVIVVVGIIISIVAGVLPSLIASAKIKQAQAVLERADLALRGFVLARHRLPFADSNDDGLEDTGIYIGGLPYQTLGLPFKRDPWDNPIKYAVYGGGAVSTWDLTQSFANATAFCTELSNAITTAFDASIAFTTSAVPCAAADPTNSSNQAYILASPGLKNQDGAAGKYDGCNTLAGPGFNLPDAILTTTYDDLVRAFSLVELNQYKCVATGGGGSPTVESPLAGTCADGLDNDSDGLTDCADPDCAADPSCSPAGFTITTASLPSGVLNSSYMTSIAASGGTTPYQWTLSGNGGFTGFALNSSTGTLTGTLDQCPGDYTIQIGAQDATTPSPQSDSESYTLTVTSTLAVTHDGGGGLITWSSPTQQETFTANGSRLGSINWTLNSGGAAGFGVYSTGAATCAVRKTGSTTPGTYTFTLTATDATCSGNTANLIFQVQITASGGGAPGAIGGVVDLLEFDTGNGANPDLIPVGDNIYAIAYTGPNGDGYLATVQIDASGQIADTVIDTLEFDFSNGEDPDITQVGGNIFAIVYTGPGNDGYVATVQIGADGQIGNTPLDTLEFETSYCYEPDILAIGPNLFAIAYTGPDNDGFITTVQIAADGQITNAVVDTIEFNSSQAYEADLIHIAGDIYAVAYAGSGMISDGYVSTVAIDSSGQISDAVLDNLEFDPSLCYDPDIVHVSGDIYAVAYRGPGDDGFIRTLQITPDGTISNATIDVLEFDPVQCNEPVIATIGGGVFLIAYRGQSNDGFLVSVQIDEAGQIGNAVLDSLEFAATDGNEPSIVSLGGGMFAVCYRGPNDDGFVVTVSMQ